jgi:hypothetical protein
MFAVSSKNIRKEVFLVALLAFAVVIGSAGAEKHDGAEKQHVVSVKNKGRKVRKSTSKGSKSTSKGSKSTSKGKKGGDKNSKKSADDDFVKYALRAIDEIQETLYDDEEYADANDIEQVRASLVESFNALVGLQS